MSRFISDYKGAFKRKRVAGFREWIVFTLKSVLLMLLLLVGFSAAQYLLIMHTPLSDYVTVHGIEQSNRYGITIVLVLSFGPSVIYLGRLCMR